VKKKFVKFNEENVSHLGNVKHLRGGEIKFIEKMVERY
jgi:hypothetical protein